MNERDQILKYKAVPNIDSGKCIRAHAQHRITSQIAFDLLQ